jgi:ribosomal protein S18 acetylase RimI-like enzyme
MHIYSLKNTPLPTLVDCLLQSFKGYFVQLPGSVEYWEERYRAARVDWALSFGMFDGKALVGFIVNGIDEFGGLKTAFNTGTGVLSHYRGQAIVDQLYAHALPIFKENGVQQCALEVICQNERAIRVYERIGFQTVRRLHCFKGDLNPCSPFIHVREVDIAVLLGKDDPERALDSWDNCNSAIRNGSAVYKAYEITREGNILGWCVINPKVGYVPRCVVANTHQQEDWEAVFEGIGQVCRSVRMNNVDTRCVQLLNGLRVAGMVNHIDQFEMAMPIG